MNESVMIKESCMLGKHSWKSPIDFDPKDFVSWDLHAVQNVWFNVVVGCLVQRWVDHCKEPVNQQLFHQYPCHFM